ncbi:MAG TPA: hypothetical protein VGB61_15645, partial [Pyrinomonadaceae bacterium]
MNARAEKSLDKSPNEDGGTTPDELNALGAEVVDIFHAQIFAPGEYATEASVCAAFSEVLLRHWNLCCLITYLRGADGRLHESAIHSHPHMDETAGRSVGRFLAGVVEESGREYGVWLDQETASTDSEEVRALFAETDIKAGIALPITARGSLIGAIVAVSS